MHFADKEFKMALNWSTIYGGRQSYEILAKSVTLYLRVEGDTPLFGLGTWGLFRAYLGLGHSGLGLESLKK